MTDPAFVFLDTQVFDSAKFNLNSRDFFRLQSLVNGGHIRLVTTSVTDRELDSHIDRFAAEAINQFRKLKGLVSGLAMRECLRDVDDSEIHREFRSAYESFQRAMDPITVGVDRVSIDRILDQYFRKSPPFGEGKKKSEFPDAIAAAALRDWCGANDCELHIVTGDGDWKKVCEDIALFRHHPNLVSVFEIFPDEDVADRVQTAIRFKTSVIERTVKDDFPNRGFYLNDVDGDVNSVSVDTVECAEFHVIEATSNTAIIDVPCVVAYSADVTYKDPDSRVNAGEGDILYLRTIACTIERRQGVRVEVKVSFEEGREQDLKVAPPEMPDDDLELTINEYEW